MTRSGSPIEQSDEAMPHLETIYHADWSVDSKKRWAARATRDGDSWRVSQTFQVSDLSAFRKQIFGSATSGAVLVGFDFPIGVPDAYGARTGVLDFRGLLAAIGSDGWTAFASVATAPGEIGTGRPFYPASSRKGVRQQSLIDAHGAASFDELRRTCERATSQRRAACPLFWTLGGNQVGKAALSGWLEVVRPMVDDGAALWPFDGPLPSLLTVGRVTIAETYPAEAYFHVGAPFLPGESKRRQESRARKAPAVKEWAASRGVRLAHALVGELDDGFGADPAGEDRLDALMGVLGMLEVASGRRPEGCPSNPAISRWEGWILGQSAVSE